MDVIEKICNLPALDEDSVHVWGIHVPAVLDRLDALHAVLCKTEQEKAARFHRDSDRHSSIAARGALRVLLAGYTTLAATEITFQYSDNGKPYIDGSDIAFNVSHSGEWVVLALGRNRQIGVDIEKIKRELDVSAIASRYFTSAEIKRIETAADQHAVFFQLWARKEAYVKACGSTLFRELSSFAVPAADDGEKDGWFFHRLEAGSRYAAAVVTDRNAAGISCYDFGGLKWEN